MFDERSYKRLFSSGPQSVTWLVAAFIEPLITVLMYIAVALTLGHYLDRPGAVLCLFVFALTLLFFLSTPSLSQSPEPRLKAGLPSVA